MKINLKKDAKDILKYLKQRVKDFDPETNEGPGEGETVHQINIGFAHTQWGFVTVIFDTRPDAEPDGSWNNRIEESSIEVGHWAEASDALYEEKTVEFTLRDGTKKKLTEYPDEEDYAELFGDTLKAMLLEARDAVVFKKLPTAKKCHIGVEEHDGRYGWPMYEDRGKKKSTL